MKIKIRSMISVVTLGASVIALFLVLKKPVPVAAPQAPAAIAENAQSFDQKMAELEQASQQSRASGRYSGGSDTQKTEVHINSNEIGAVIAQSLGTASSMGNLAPDANLGGGAAPTIKDQQVSFEGDVVRGQFLTEIAGKDVWVTISGHIGEKDGYATFDPTEFKVGDLNVPVSLVNPALQKKLEEQRDRLKLPDFVGDVRVHNSELVMQQR